MNFLDKIYVAGANGMVGSAITRRLKLLGFQNLLTPSSRELNLLNQNAVEDFFINHQPQYVFLAAAKVGGIWANNTQRADFIYQNLMIEANVIQAAHQNKVKKLLFLGSSCIYPKLAPQPLREDSLLTGTLEPTNEPYAIAKIAGIKLCEAYRSQYQQNFISVMPTNLYGQKDNYDLHNSHVLPALIRKFYLGKSLENNNLEAIARDLSHYPIQSQKHEQLSKEQILDLLKRFGIKQEGGDTFIDIWGTGTPLREFMYADDLADACVFLMQNYNEEQFVNIGTGQEISIKELALLVKEIVGFKGDVCFDTTKPDGTPRKLLDVSKLHGLGWKAQISLADGIKMAFEHYLNI
ncbi:MAG: GDP-L-fucose synthase [Cytophagales bacterium]|nr:MAG: GDP-L-fucose synthase [Cytophagales bacterium]TAF60499.1 MAG: GDP-L-fucose synthase [Cytophagales bacterium]